MSKKIPIYLPHSLTITMRTATVSVWSSLVPKSPKVELVSSLRVLVWGRRLEELLKRLTLKLKTRSVDLLLSGGRLRLFWVSWRPLLYKSSMLSAIVAGFY